MNILVQFYCSQNLGNDREEKSERKSVTFGFDDEKRISDILCLN